MKTKKLLYGIIVVFLITVGVAFFICAKRRTPTEPPIKAAKEVKTTCSTDGGCLLINQELDFACCWVGGCESLDYSQDKWVAVNRESFEQLRKNNCPPAEKCGPPPLCEPKPINDKFIASCINRSCQKVPKEETPIVIKDIVELCETENPLFSPAEECQKIIDEKYPSKECTFELGPIEWLPMESCRDCIINCQ